MVFERVSRDGAKGHMHWISNILREIIGLFVDDGSFALAILLWIGLVRLILPRLHLPIPGGLILFAGLAIILIESASRFSRRNAG